MPQQKLRVLTYNVKMLPGPFGNGDADLARAERIAQAITSTVPAWDIVCLQEVFDEDAREVFVNMLKPKLPHQVPKSSDNDIFDEDSGLFFASRIPIAGSGFREYQAHAGDDALADKGIFGARLALDDAWVVVFNTHLQASLGESAVRQQQLGQIHAFVRASLERIPRSKKPYAILCGDLNVVGENLAGVSTEEYLKMLARLGSPRDLFRHVHPFDTAQGFTWDGANNLMIPRSDHDKQRLDYVLSWDRLPERNDNDNPPSIGRVDVEQIAVARFETATPNACMSDHFAVDATLSLVG